MANLIIDVETHDVNKLMGRLKRLKSTINVENGGMYRMGMEYSQVWLETTKSLEEVEEWLWRYSNCDYVGAVAR